MCKGHWIHSLRYFEFIELTLKMNGFLENHRKERKRKVGACSLDLSYQCSFTLSLLFLGKYCYCVFCTQTFLEGVIN